MLTQKYRIIASALCFLGLFALFQNCGKFEGQACSDCESSSAMGQSSVDGESTVVDTEILPIDLERDPIADFQKRDTSLDSFVEDTNPQESIGMENYYANASFSFKTSLLGLFTDRQMMEGFNDTDVIDFYYRPDETYDAELLQSVKLSQLISTDERDKSRIKFLILDVISQDAKTPLLRLSSQGIEVRAKSLNFADSGEYWVVVRVSDKSIRFPTWTLSVESADCSPGTYYTAEVPAELAAYEGIFIERTAGGDYAQMNQKDLIERIYPDLFSNFFGLDFDEQGYDGFGQGKVGTTLTKNICGQYIPFVNSKKPSEFRAIGGEITFECRAKKWRVIKNTCEFEKL